VVKTLRTLGQGGGHQAGKIQVLLPQLSNVQLAATWIEEPLNWIGSLILLECWLYVTTMLIVTNRPLCMHAVDAKSTHSPFRNKISYKPEFGSEFLSSRIEKVGADALPAVTVL
jgi:hypothetical protein